MQSSSTLSRGINDKRAQYGSYNSDQNLEDISSMHSKSYLSSSQSSFKQRSTSPLKPYSTKLLAAMSRRDPYRGKDTSRRVRLSLPDDEYIPGESSPRDKGTDSEATSVASYPRIESPFSSQASGRTVNDMLLGRGRGSYSDEDLLSSLSRATGSAYSDAGRTESDYAGSSVAGSTTRSESTVQTEAPLRESRRQQPDISHWESRTMGHQLEYGEEPTSVLANIDPAEYGQVFERQKLPMTAHRERIIPSTQSEWESFSELLNDIHPPSRIRKGLYIANYETACHYLCGNGNKTKGYPKVNHVLSIINFQRKAERLYNDLKPANPKEFPTGSRMLLIVKDSIQVNLMELFPTIVDFIRKALRKGGNVLVHCRKGMSRSVAAAMAYLIWAENANVIDVWRDVVQLRKVAWPNAEFYTQLVMWRMWDCKLVERDGKVNSYYEEYVVEKGLSSALLDANIDIWHRLGLEPPEQYYELMREQARK